MLVDMISALSFSALGLILAYIFYIQRSCSRRDDSKGAVALPSYPIVGSLFALLKNRRRMPEWSTEHLARAPSHTIKLERLGGIKLVITANPANVEHILKTRFDNYAKGDFSSGLVHDLLGNGIFNVDGEPWRLQRKVAISEFKTRSLRDFITEVVQGEATDRLLPLLRKAADSEEEGGNRLDMQDVLRRFTFDNICKVAFGYDPVCLDISLPVSELAEAFDTATDLIGRRFGYPLQFAWKVKRMLNLGSEKRLRQAIGVVHKFAEEVIQTRKKEISLSLSLSSASTHQDLLCRFLSLHDSAAVEKVSYEDFLRDIVISFILAGRDTSSGVLTWFFWLLSSHPEVEQRIYEEITGVIAARQVEVESGFSFDELREMKYLHASLCETMRLYPPVPSNAKEALQDDMLPDGTVVRKGMRVSYHPYAMGRMESIWGTDCLEFKPERWLTEDGRGSPVSVAEINAFKYPVFQAGPRICLGKEMAFIQMKCIAASVLKEFRLKVDDSFNPRYVAGLTAKMEMGLPVRVERSRQHANVEP